MSILHDTSGLVWRNVELVLGGSKKSIAIVGYKHKRAHSCHVNIDTRTFSRKKVDLQISADASEPVLGTSLGCAQVWHDFRSLKMFKSSQTVYS